MTQVDPQTGEKKTVNRLGIGPSKPVWVTQSIGRAFVESVVVTWDLCAMTLKGITEMLTGKRGGDELGGILAIGDMASQSTKGGFATAVWFMVLLSVNLGFLNLLPIPVLDGGHMLLCGIEAARGKPLSEKLQERIFLVGFIVLMMLMLYSTWNDLVRYGVASFFAGMLAKLKALF
jgi:regulator of sigma E protease